MICGEKREKYLSQPSFVRNSNKVCGRDLRERATLYIRTLIRKMLIILRIRILVIIPQTYVKGKKYIIFLVLELELELVLELMLEQELVWSGNRID